MSTPTPLDAIINLPLLTAEEERELGRLIQRNGTAGKAALATMTERNLRLVGSIAARFVNRSSLTFYDLVQEGSLGLIHAALKFDPERGNKFSTYATPWIEQLVRRAISQQGFTIRLPVYKYEQLCQLSAVTERLRKTNDEPTIEQIAAEMDLPAEKVMELFATTNQPDSLERLVYENGTADHYDFQSDDTIPQPDRTAEQNILREKIAAALSILTAREVKIIKLRYGLDDGCSRTLTEVGDIFGLSRERIRQIEGGALEKLGGSIEVRKLWEFMDA